jgi:hypothetical protein
VLERILERRECVVHREWNRLRSVGHSSTSQTPKFHSVSRRQPKNRQCQTPEIAALRNVFRTYPCAASYCKSFAVKTLVVLLNVRFRTLSNCDDAPCSANAFMHVRQ